MRWLELNVKNNWVVKNSLPALLLHDVLLTPALEPELGVPLLCL